MQIDLNKVYNRSAVIDSNHIDVEARTVRLSFASGDAITPQYFGDEQLVVSRESVNMDYLNNSAPLLLNHDRENQIGVVEKAWIDDGERKAYAIVRFSRNAVANDVFNDVIDGIRRNISVGYKITEAKSVQHNGKELIRATKWTPKEISSVSIPADITVGVGRADNDDTASKVEVEVVPKQEVINMEPVEVEVSRADIDNAILATGTQLNDVELARDVIASNGTVDDFKRQWREKKKVEQEKTPVMPPSHLDLSKKQRKQFSLVRAIASRLDDTRKSTFEDECSNEIAKRLGKAPRSFYVPYDIQTQDFEEFANRSDVDVYRAILNKLIIRAQQEVATPSLGGYLVGDDLLASSFIDLLRSKIVVTRLGATFLTGLVGDVTIPKQLTSTTAEWVDEAEAPAEGNITVGNIKLALKTLAARGQYTRKLLLQSTPSIEMLVRNDMSAVMARGIDKGAILAGGGKAPVGILGQAGVHSITGTDFDKSIAVSMWTAIAEADAVFDGAAFLTTPTIKGELMTRPEMDNTIALPLLKDNGTMIGYRVEDSTQIPANHIIFGYWSQLIIGEWGNLDVLVNPYLYADTGNVSLHMFQSADVNVRHGVAFSKVVAFT